MGDVKISLKLFSVHLVASKPGTVIPDVMDRTFSLQGAIRLTTVLASSPAFLPESFAIRVNADFVSTRVAMRAST